MTDEQHPASPAAGDRFPREEFIKRAARYGLALPVASASAMSYLASAASASSAVRAAIQPGGTLRIGTSDNFTDFNPHHEAFGDYPFFNQLYGQPFRDRNQPNAALAIPWLATDLEMGPGARYVDITLRQGVTFHGGDPLNAQALIANWDHVRDPKKSHQAGVWQAIFKSSKAINEYKARLTFKQSTAPELVRELHQRLSLISPTLIKKGEKALLTQADGTGAFRLTKYSQGSIAVMERNADFVGRRPYLDSIEFHFFTDPDAMVAGLRSGDVDMVVSLPVQNVASLKNEFQVIAGPPATCYNIPVRSDPTSPFARIEARHALQRLINRKRFATELMFNTGTATFAFVPKGALGWSPAINNPFPYDPARAKSEFEKLGMLNASEPLQVVQLQGAFPLIGRLAEMVAADMNAIGLKAELVPVDIAIWAERFFGSQAGSFDLITSFSGRTNRYPSLTAIGNSGSEPYTNASYLNKKPPAPYTKAFLDMTYAVSPAEQKRASEKYIKTHVNYSFDLPVAFQRTEYALSKKLKGFAIGRDDWLIADGMYFNG